MNDRKRFRLSGVIQTLFGAATLDSRGLARRSNARTEHTGRVFGNVLITLPTFDAHKRRRFYRLFTVSLTLLKFRATSPQL